MPKHNLNDIVKQQKITSEKQENLEKIINDTNSTAIASLIIGSLALVITLCSIAIS